MRPIDTQPPADTRHCLRYWPVTRAQPIDTSVQTNYTGVINRTLALPGDFAQLSQTAHPYSNDRISLDAMLYSVGSTLSLGSSEIRSVRFKRYPEPLPTNLSIPLLQSIEACNIYNFARLQCPAETAAASGNIEGGTSSVEDGYNRLFAYIQDSTKPNRIDPPNQDMPLAISQRPKRKLDVVPKRPLPKNIVEVEVVIDVDESIRRKRSRTYYDADNISMPSTSHAAERLDDYLTKLFHEDDRISDNQVEGAALFECVQSSTGGNNTYVIGRKAIREICSLLTQCGGPEQLRNVISDDIIGRLVGLLIHAIEAADNIGLAGMLKSGMLVEKGTALSSQFCSQIDIALSVSYLGLLASGMVIRLAASGMASKIACTGDSLHTAVAFFKVCLLESIVPLFDLTSDSVLATALSDSDNYLHSRMQAFLGAILAAHDPVIALVSQPALPEQDVISLVYASISTIFCNSNSVLIEGTDNNQFESIKRSAQALLRNIFEVRIDQRSWILEEILASLARVPVHKRSKSVYRIAGGKSVHLITALLLKLLQCTACTPEDLTAGFGGGNLPIKEYRMMLDKHKKAIDSASSSVDYAIRYLIGRCAKRDGKTTANEIEYRALLEMLISDCLILLCHPQWPAAELLVRVFSIHIVELLNDDKADIVLKNLALESTASIASHIALTLQEVSVISKSKYGGMPLEMPLPGSTLDSIDMFRSATITLLGYLQSKATAGESTGAIPLYISNWAAVLIDTLIKGSGKDNSSAMDTETGSNSGSCSDSDNEDDGEIKLTTEKRQLIEECLKEYMTITHRSTKTMPHGINHVNATEATKLFCSVLPLYRSFSMLLSRVTSALGASQVTLRSKALRALNQIASHRSSVLYQSSVKKAINHRLQDSSPQVREAAIDLIGKHIAQNPDLTNEYYEFISVRILDKGSSVRRRVMRILKSIYIRSEDLTQLVDIGVRLLYRTVDDERTIRELAFKTLHALWFTHGKVTADTDEDSRAAVAAEMGSGSGSLGNAFNLLPPEEQKEILKRVRVMTGVMDTTRSQEVEDLMNGLFEHVTTKVSNYEVENAMFVIRCMVGALFEQLLQSEEEDEKFVFSTTACLQFISTLSAIDPHAVGLHAEALGAYLKLNSVEDDEKLCHALTALQNTLLTIPHPSSQFLRSLESDLVGLLSSSPQRVVSIAVPCLCHLVDKLTWNYGKLLKLFRSCVLQLYREYRLIGDGGKGMQSSKNLMRFIVLAGLLCCHFDFDKQRMRQQQGEDLFKDLEQLFGANTVVEYMNGQLLFFASSQLPPSVQLAAIQMLGQLYIKQPKLAIEKPARGVMDRVFASDSANHKLQVVRNFLEFLQADAKKHADRAKRDGANENKRVVDAKALVGDTGEMGEAGVGASLMQTYLDRVIDATFVSNMARLRMAGFEVITQVLEQGLAHPLKCVPALIALSTSRDPYIRTKSLKLHQDLSLKYASFIHSRDIDGVRKVYEYQVQVCDGETSKVVGYAVEDISCEDGVSVSGVDSKRQRPIALLQPLYSLIRSKRARRDDFLTLLVRIADADAGISYSAAWRNDIPFVRFVAENIATLNFVYVDEVLHVCHQIGSVVAGTGMSLCHHFDTTAPTILTNKDKQEVVASVCVGIMFVLREFLKTQYDISEEKCLAFNSKGIAASAGSRSDKTATVTWNGGTSTSIDWLQVWPYAVKHMKSIEDINDQRSRYKKLVAGSLAAVASHSFSGDDEEDEAGVDGNDLDLDAGEMEQLVQSMES